MLSTFDRYGRRVPARPRVHGGWQALGLLVLVVVAIAVLL